MPPAAMYSVKEVS